MVQIYPKLVFQHVTLDIVEQTIRILLLRHSPHHWLTKSRSGDMVTFHPVTFSLPTVLVPHFP